MQHVNNKYEAALAEGEAAGLPLGELADLRVAAGRWQTNCGSPARGVELLTQAVQGFEKHAWFLRASLEV